MKERNESARELLRQTLWSDDDDDGVEGVWTTGEKRRRWSALGGVGAATRSSRMSAGYRREDAKKTSEVSPLSISYH